MKKIIFLLCSILLFYIHTESTVVSATSKMKGYTFVPIPASISDAACQEFTLHFSNICTRADLRAYPVAVKQNAQTYSCKLLWVNDNGTSARYAPCQTLPKGTYSLQKYSKIGFTIVSSPVTDTALPSPNTPSKETFTATPAPDNLTPEEPTQPTAPPHFNYSYTLTAQTKKHEKISHALVDIYLDNQCILSGETDSTGVYHIESTIFQPDAQYTVRIYKPISASEQTKPEEKDTSEVTPLSFEPQELSLRFSNTHSQEQNVILYEPPEISPLPVTICWSIDAWNARGSEHPSVRISLWNTDKSFCLLEQTHTPSVTAMTASLSLFETGHHKLPSGSYVLRVSISDDTFTQPGQSSAAFEYPLKLLHGEWITPVFINLP